MILSVSMITGMAGGVIFATGQPVRAATASSISASEFEDPDQTYQPGVRWWWPGAAVTREEIKRELDLMKEYHIGHVEINPFAVTGEDVTGVYTDAFYDMLDYAITVAEENGIGVSINMGTGWNANSADVTLDESMGNMALGREELTGDQMTDGIAVPSAEESILYYGTSQKGDYDASLAKLQGVLVAEKAGDGVSYESSYKWIIGTATAFNTFKDADGTEVSYPCQILLNNDNSIFIDASALNDGKISASSLSDLTINNDSTYEIIALYSVPSGGKAIEGAEDWYVIDHMDADKVTSWLNTWIGNSRLKTIISSHSNIDSFFNDSYEFFSDDYYTDSLYDLAKDAENNGLGYDFSKYLPTVYKEYSGAPFFSGLGTSASFFSLDSDEQSRIEYDYSVLVGEKFAEGMKAFDETLDTYGMEYRQEAYNPPIDTIGAAQYIDIPETEQGNSLNMIRISSGADLYGKNLVTCEQYTLGCLPFTNTLEELKIGFDKMATSGVNNFNYHGWMYDYGEDSEKYGENGWAPFPTIGVNASDDNTLSKYFPVLNEYASRVNYLMQQGKISKDVAVYMPYNGSLSETDTVKALNVNGLTWDAINDDSIQSGDTTVVNGKISANGGNVTYDAIVIEDETVPVETMQALQKLAEAGANIIFAAVPNAQPSYADGKYAEKDSEVQSIVSSMQALASVKTVSGQAQIEEALTSATDPEIGVARNENVRVTRRTLSDGAELMYIRNLSSDANAISLDVSKYGNCYWLDQNTGKIYQADVENGKLDFTITGSDATYDGSIDRADSTDSHSMAIALLAEPAGNTGFSASELTSGVPDELDQTVYLSHKVNVKSLTVTADNFDKQIGGDTETKTFTDNVLGKWNDASFQDGVLQNVVSDGVYEATVNYSNVYDRALLQLDGLYTAASITVNGTNAGEILYAPTRLDITDLLKDGENSIEITVTPRKGNRYVNDANGLYSMDEYQDAGLEGVELLTTSNQIFEDVTDRDAYFYEPVYWAVQKEITNGTATTVFTPSAACTRAQIVTFLWRAAGSPESDASTAFTDIKEGSYYETAVKWAYENGICKGTTAKTFSPDKACTRAEAVTFLWRATSPEKVSDQTSFEDVKPDAYYAEAVSWAAGSGITLGTSETTFSPAKTVNRGEMVTFLYRAR